MSKTNETRLKRFTFVALRTHPAVVTAALAVIGPASSIMETCAPLSASNAPRIGWTRNRTVVPLPARKTSAMTYIEKNLNLPPQDKFPVKTHR